MADFNYDEYNSRDYASSGQTGPGVLDRARRWVNVSGAACSVGLILGLALWGYQLAVRDVTGVPVMRAQAGAMRIAPLDPGGEQALNQGLTVNAIAAMGTSAASADTITLAPQAVDLQSDDLPLATTQAAVTDAVVAAADAANAPADNGTLTEVSATTLEAGTQIGADADPTLIVPADPNAMRVSIRPQPRPASISASGKATVTGVQDTSGTVPATAPTSKELDSATIPAGTRLAQLGAYETPDLARAQFASLQQSLGELMTGKDMVIQAAQSGGRTFYRLRAHGFANDDDARRFCAALLAEEVDCIPVAQR